MPTLTSDGLTVERAAALLTAILDDLETKPGVGTIDRTRLDDRVDGQLASVMADRLDAIGQALVAVFSARSRNNATGRQLDDLGEITGTFRNPATYSTATVTCSGVNGTIIPAGRVVEHATTGTRWVTQEAKQILGGSVDVAVQAQDPGAVVAEAATLTKIASGVTGWTSVTNAAAAAVGSARESDADYRVRQLTELAGPGASTTNSIRAALSALSAVDAAVVISNNSSVPATVHGVSLPASSLAVYLWPSSLSTAEKALAAQAIWDHAPAGIEQYGTQSATVTDVAGNAQTVKWSWATEVPLTVAQVTVVLRAGYVISDVDAAIEEIVLAYIAALSVGDPIVNVELDALIMAEVGSAMLGITYAWNDGTGLITSNYTPEITEIVTLASGNLTVTT